MHQTWTVELFVYIATSLSALLLLPRCVNWRLRLIVGIIGLQGLAQSLTELKMHHPFWQSRLADMAGTLELFGGALALTAIHLLRRENSARKSTEARLRLSEAAEGVPVPGSAVQNDAGSLVPQRAVSNGNTAPHPAPQNGQPESPRSLRKSRRFPVAISAIVTVLDGEKQVAECKVADISQGGANLLVPFCLAPGRLVKIEFQYRIYLAEVCHSQKLGDSYTTGVEFEHILDLTELSRVLREVGYLTKDAGLTVVEPLVNAKSA